MTVISNGLSRVSPRSVTIDMALSASEPRKSESGSVKYPKTTDTVDLLIEAARHAANETDSTGYLHPHDVACAMITAIENSWPVVLEAYGRFTTED